MSSSIRGVLWLVGAAIILSSTYVLSRWEGRAKGAGCKQG